ncbi:MAG: hypothetical protein HKO03_01755 [Acidimicrobiia bacterium]|nr:hypothetical protein [Acidimicrobiia bacterium]
MIFSIPETDDDLEFDKRVLSNMLWARELLPEQTFPFPAASDTDAVARHTHQLILGTGDEYAPMMSYIDPDEKLRALVGLSGGWVDIECDGKELLHRQMFVALAPFTSCLEEVATVVLTTDAWIRDPKADMEVVAEALMTYTIRPGSISITEQEYERDAFGIPQYEPSKPVTGVSGRTLEAFASAMAMRATTTETIPLSTALYVLAGNNYQVMVTT